MACSRMSTTAGARHGKTSAGGHGTGRAGTNAGSGGRDIGGSALRAGSATSGATRCNLGGNRWGNGRGACHCAQIPSAFAQTAGAACGAPAKMGRSAQGLDERGRGAQLPSPLGEALRRRRDVLVVSPLRAALSQRLGRPVAASVVYRLLARHGWRKVAPDTRHPKSDPAAQEEWKKNSPRCWRPC